MNKILVLHPNNMKKRQCIRYDNDNY